MFDIVFEVKHFAEGIINLDVEGVISVVPLTIAVEARDAPPSFVMVRLLNVDEGIVWGVVALKRTVPFQGWMLEIGKEVVF